MKKRFKVRFHLGKGKNYMKWQVTDHKNNFYKDYYDPEKVDILMYKCKLGNQESIARKIFNGEHKTVCAWVECDMIDIVYKGSPEYNESIIDGKNQYRYNPRIWPHWSSDDVKNADNMTFVKMQTKGRKIYA
jgi:hypothetical protein